MSQQDCINQDPQIDNVIRRTIKEYIGYYEEGDPECILREEIFHYNEKCILNSKETRLAFFARDDINNVYGFYPEKFLCILEYCEIH